MNRDHKELKGKLKVGELCRNGNEVRPPWRLVIPRVGHWPPGNPLGSPSVPVKKGLELSGMERASVLPYMADRCTVMHTSEQGCPR